MSTTTGPIFPAPSTLITINDPTPNSACDRVQIQNGSTFALLVAGSIEQVTIAPNTSLTIDSYGGANITILPSLYGSAVAGISFLWLYPGDEAPPDGALAGTVPGGIPLGNMFLGGLAGSGPIVKTLTLPPGVTTILAFLVMNGGGFPIGLTGLTFTGNITDYVTSFSFGATAVLVQKLYQVPVAPASDSVVTVSFQIVGGGGTSVANLALYALTLPVLNQNTPDQPLYVSATDPEPLALVQTAVHLSAASAAGGILLAAPAAGQMYEILKARVWSGAATTPANASTNWMTFNPGTSSALLQGSLAGPGSVVENMPSDYFIGQAVSYSSNPFTVGSIQFELSYRVLTQA